MAETVRSCLGPSLAQIVFAAKRILRKLCGRASGYQQAGSEERTEISKGGNSGSPDPWESGDPSYPFSRALEPIVPTPALRDQGAKVTHYTWNSIPGFSCFFLPQNLRDSQIPRTLPPHHLRTLSCTGLAVGCRQHHCGEMREAPQLIASHAQRGPPATAGSGAHTPHPAHTLSLAGPGH